MDMVPALHPDAGMALRELHARPFPALTAPCVLRQVVAVHDAPRANDSEVAAATGGLGRLLLERRTEATTFVLIQQGADEEPAAMRRLMSMVGQATVAVTTLHIVPGNDPGHDLAIGSGLGDPAAPMATDFGAAGGSEVVIHLAASALTPAGLGRMAQRLLDIHVYTALALRAVPSARALVGGLGEMENRLADLTARLNEPTGPEQERALLDRLTALAAEAERADASYAYRFGAARAYGAIVSRRLAELRETRLPGRQPLTEFLDRRLEPALATTASVEGRMHSLSARVGRASALLRTRIELRIAAGNRDLLASLDRRSQTQLRLQTTVEGLSVIAITYYATQLVAQVAAGISEVGYAVPPAVAAAVAAPLIGLVTWLGIRRLRKAVEKE